MMVAISSRALALALVTCALAAGCDDETTASPAVPDATPDAMVVEDATVSEPDVAVPDMEPPRPDARPDLRCEEACDALATCAVESDACPGVGPDEQAAYVEACVPACEANAALLEIIDGQSCDVMVTRVRSLSDDFDDRCAVPFTLTLLHTQGSVADLLPQPAIVDEDRQVDAGGGARVAALLSTLQTEAEARGGVISVHAGDLLAPGRAYELGLVSDPAQGAMGQILAAAGFDAIALGEGDLALGPDALAAFLDGITAVEGVPPVLASNLIPGEEAAIQAHFDAGSLITSRLVETGGHQVGIVSVMAEELATVVSPRGLSGQVPLSSMILEVLRLQELGVDKIILLAHQQSFFDDQLLALQALGVDVVVSGGGPIFMGGPDDPRRSVDLFDAELPYPLMVLDGIGQPLPIVTVPDEFQYVGRLVVTFDDQGRISSVDNALSGPIGVWVDDVREVAFDNGLLAALKADVEIPLAEALEGPGEILADTTVGISGANSMLQEVNAGDLFADAILWEGQALAESYGAEVPTIALLPGGDIEPITLPEGEGAMTAKGVYDLMPEPQIIGVFQLTRIQLKALMEHAFSGPLEMADERFPQIAGFRVFRDRSGEARTLHENGTLNNAGSRVWEIQLADGTRLVREGRVEDPAYGLVHIVTTEAMIAGAYGYPFQSFTAPDFIRLGSTVQQAVQGFVTVSLEGLVSAEAYPLKGADRILERNGL